MTDGRECRADELAGYHFNRVVTLSDGRSGKLRQVFVTPAIDDEEKACITVSIRTPGGGWINANLDPSDIVTIAKTEIQLPTEPGTVIAIGEWWLVRLRSYEGAQPAWEMLPLPTKALSDQAKRNGAHEQCVVSDDWVRVEAEQEGNFRIVSSPAGVTS